MLQFVLQCFAAQVFFVVYMGLFSRQILSVSAAGNVFHFPFDAHGVSFDVGDLYDIYVFFHVGYSQSWR